MQSEIKIGQRFKFNISSDNPSQERQAVVTRVLSNEEALGPEIDFYLAYWVEADELPETAAPTKLVFERGVDGNVYLEGHQVSITLLK